MKEEEANRIKAGSNTTEKMNFMVYNDTLRREIGAEYLLLKSQVNSPLKIIDISILLFNFNFYTHKKGIHNGSHKDSYSR